MASMAAARTMPFPCAPVRVCVMVVVVGLLMMIGRVDGLYSASDKVQLMDSTNFEKWVFGSKAAWVVEFYSSWCGFCKGFAPTWKKLGVEINGWRGALRLGALDCADDANVDICRRYVPVGYPTVRLFPPGVTSKDFEGEQIEAVVRETVESLISRLTDFAEEVKDKYNMDHYPHLRLLRDEDLPPTQPGDLARMIVIEGSDKLSEGDIDTRPLLLESALYKGVKAFRISPNHPFRNQLKIQSVPAVIFLDKNGNIAEKHENKILLKEQVHLAFEHLLGKEKVLESFEYNSGVPRADESHSLRPNTVKRAEYPPLIPVHMEDLESAIGYALRHEVVLKREVNGQPRQALIKFLQMLLVYFPGEDLVLKGLQEVEKYVNEHISFTGDEFKQFLDPLDGMDGRGLIPKSKNYITCKGSSDK
ncbi:unnamed protein product [Notodromas monacha]|nr:unnamed protein product [Notodromas monacha]CAG0919338.1 unnamed protein product [Notodromas monacha]